MTMMVTCLLEIVTPHFTFNGSCLASTVYVVFDLLFLMRHRHRASNFALDPASCWQGWLQSFSYGCNIGYVRRRAILTHGLRPLQTANRPIAASVNLSVRGKWAFDATAGPSWATETPGLACFRGLPSSNAWPRSSASVVSLSYRFWPRISKQRV